MITAKATINGNTSFLLVLEPANLERLRLGQPIVQKLNEFLPELPENIEIAIAFTPDIPWVMSQVKAGENLVVAVQSSLERPEVYSRPFHATEVLSKPDLSKD